MEGQAPKLHCVDIHPVTMRGDRVLVEQGIHPRLDVLGKLPLLLEVDGTCRQWPTSRPATCSSVPSALLLRFEHLQKPKSCAQGRPGVPKLGGMSRVPLNWLPGSFSMGRGQAALGKWLRLTGSVVLLVVSDTTWHSKSWCLAWDQALVTEHNGALLGALDTSKAHGTLLL